MSENGMWLYMRKLFPQQGHGDWQRIEDSLSKGVPDVNYCIAGVEGWIELKYIEEWPKRDKTPVRFRWTKEQRIWAGRRLRAGGVVWVLLKVGLTRDWLLFYCDELVRNNLGLTINKAGLLDIAVFHSRGNLPIKNTLGALSRGTIKADLVSDRPSTLSN